MASFTTHTHTHEHRGYGVENCTLITHKTVTRCSLSSLCFLTHWREKISTDIINGEQNWKRIYMLWLQCAPANRTANDVFFFFVWGTVYGSWMNCLLTTIAHMNCFRRSAWSGHMQRAFELSSDLPSWLVDKQFHNRTHTHTHIFYTYSTYRTANDMKSM